MQTLEPIGVTHHRRDTRLSWQEFTTAPVDKGVALSYEARADLSAGAASDWFIIPAGIRALTATVTPSGGATAIVQTTTDRVNDIKDETFNVSYNNWEKGEVSAAYSDSTHARVSAIRCIHTNAIGAVRFTVAI